MLGVLLDQFRSFIIYILLFATAFALLVGEYLDVPAEEMEPVLINETSTWFEVVD